MRILLIGEASYVHNTLRRAFRAKGHEVVLMSDGNVWHDSPRDIDLRRDLSQGKWGGVKVMLRLLCQLPRLRGFDIVQITNPNCVPLRLPWNIRLLRYLKRHNRRVVMGCFGDDPVILKRQEDGVLEYCDTFWNGRPQMQRENAQRIAGQQLPEAWAALRNAVQCSARLVACLYEYYLCYDCDPYRSKLRYLPLPIDLPDASLVRTKGQGETLRILVGIQSQRDYMKGASVIASWLEQLATERPDRIQLMRAEDVPYDEYCRMLDEADVLVDQLYSYTPAMNALAAMARGTVVIGGGEESYYRFIGEDTLRPIINVRPDRPEESMATLRHALLTSGEVERMSRESRAFVAKYHTASLVAERYVQLYEEMLNE